MTATEMGFAPGQFDDAEEDENELDKLEDRVLNYRIDITFFHQATG